MLEIIRPVNFSGGGYMPGILDYIEVLIQIFQKKKYFFLLEE
jgi:hypothetical protein